MASKVRSGALKRRSRGPGAHTCSRCRESHVACDGSRPCSRCLRLGVECGVGDVESPGSKGGLIHEKIIEDRVSMGAYVDALSALEATVQAQQRLIDQRSRTIDLLLSLLRSRVAQAPGFMGQEDRMVETHRRLVRAHVILARAAPETVDIHVERPAEYSGHAHDIGCFEVRSVSPRMAAILGIRMDGASLKLSDIVPAPIRAQYLKAHEENHVEAAAMLRSPAALPFGDGVHAIISFVKSAASFQPLSPPGSDIQLLDLFAQVKFDIAKGEPRQMHGCILSPPRRAAILNSAQMSFLLLDAPQEPHQCVMAEAAKLCGISPSKSLSSPVLTSPSAEESQVLTTSDESNSGEGLADNPKRRKSNQKEFGTEMASDTIPPVSSPTPALSMSSVFDTGSLFDDLFGQSTSLFPNLLESDLFEF